jgi:hypothetical protein
MGMKFCVLIFFFLAPWISQVGDWALRWTEGDEALQVIFVMLIFPLIMNATQYYIIDSFIKNQKSDHELIPDDDDVIDHEAEFRGEANEGEATDSGDDDELAAKTYNEGKNAAIDRVKRLSESGLRSPQTGLLTGSKDYDPIYDGESSPTVFGSSSSSSARERLINIEDEGTGSTK